MDPIAQAQADQSTAALTQPFIIRELNRQLEAERDDRKSLAALIKVKNEAIVRLEAENVRLKMARTDKELTSQVEGLRKEVGTKDRRLVEVERALANMKDSEVVTLRRAVMAEQKILIVQNTMTSM